MKRFLTLGFLILIISLWCSDVIDVESSTYYRNITSGLEYNRAFMNSLESYRDPIDYFANDEKNKLREDPLYLADLTKQIRKNLNRKDDAKLLYLLDLLGQDSDKYPRNYYFFQDLYNKDVLKPKDLFIYVTYLYETVSLLYKSVFEKLSDEEIKLLLDYVERDVDSYSIVSPEQIEYILEKIDFEKLFKAGFILNTGLSVISKEAGKLTFSNSRPLENKSKYGVMIIGTMDNDVYSEEYTFILDPGGNDSYNLQPIKQREFLGLIDFAGNDSYLGNKELLSVDFGICCSYDLGGNDTYRADRIFSAQFGYQFHTDQRGDDTYTAETRSCGYASFGLSLLQDTGGSDVYLVDSYSLGSAFCGGIGVLFDKWGDDLYLSKPINSMIAGSQGFGWGSQGCEGGIGILFDKDGNDAYFITNLGQSAAVMNGLGLLIDEVGNDSFNSGGRAQGYAEHGSFASLYNGEGDDKYMISTEDISSSAQSWSFVLKRDFAGNDIYCNPFGSLFSFKESGFFMFDFSGDDDYRCVKQDSTLYSIGSGFFQDIYGDDKYSSSFFQNDSTMTSGYYCTFTDSNSIPTPLSREFNKIERVVYSDEIMPDKELVRIKKKVEAVYRLNSLPDSTEGKWELVKELVHNPEEAVRYALLDLFNFNNYSEKNTAILDSLCIDKSFRVSVKAKQIKSIVNNK